MSTDRLSSAAFSEDPPRELPPAYAALLAEPLLTPPAGFSQRVLARIEAAGPAPAAPPPAASLPRWRWLAALGGGAAGLLGLTQLLAFIFGIWAATAAS